MFIILLWLIKTSEQHNYFFHLTHSLFLYIFSLSLCCVCLCDKFVSSCENNNLEDFDNWQSQISSEEDNSPTQMNNCRKFIDKAPLVKRLSINLLRSTEEYRPLLCNSLLLQKTKASIAKNYLSTSSSFIPLASTNDGYTDEQQFHDADEMISSKFGDSCRKSLTSMLDNRRKDYHEIDYKRNFGLRETSSGKYHLLRRIFWLSFLHHWFLLRAEIFSFFHFIFILLT